MSRESGFTLVELLVAMSLLSMVVLVGSAAFGLYGERWDGRLGQFDAKLRATQNLFLVQESLDSLVPYVARDRNGKPVIYFEGNRNGFVAVSSKSLLSEGNYAVVRFSVRENSDLSYDVLYEEYPMVDDLLLTIGTPLPFSRPLTLFRSVADPVFSYLGWSDIEERQGEILAPPRWVSEYNGVKAWFSPLKAKLIFSSSLGEPQIIGTIAAQRDGLLSRYQVGEYDCNC